MTKKPVKKKKPVVRKPYSVKITVPGGNSAHNFPPGVPIATNLPIMALADHIIWQFESTEDRDTMLKTLACYKQMEFHGSTKIANLDVNLETGIVRVQTSKILSL